MTRPDRLSGIRLAAVRSLSHDQLARVFDQPESAIDWLTQDLALLWEHHRTDDVGERRIGTLELSSGAYVQWIGFSDCLGVEVSSNAYLPETEQLTSGEEATLVRAGFTRPDDDDPNFWLEVRDASDCGRAAFAVVAALTSVFGVYAG